MRFTVKSANVLLSKVLDLGHFLQLVVYSFYQHLLAEELPRFGYYMEKALEYLDKFWAGFTPVSKRRGNPIDNNAAGRLICLFCTKRKMSFHFGSNGGVEMSAVYHGIVRTLRMQERSLWEPFGSVFRGVLMDDKEYLSLPGLRAGKKEIEQIKNQVRIRRKPGAFAGTPKFGVILN